MSLQDAPTELVRHPLVHDPACRVDVADRNGHLAIVAAAHIPVGGAVLFIDGQTTEQPSRYSVQVAVGTHVDVVGDLDRDGSAGRHVWRFLNHSCAPNAVLHERMLIASRAIAAGEEVTFDYDANEWEMAEPFECRCGSPSCRGWIRGFRYLSSAQRRALAPLISPHITQLLQNG